MRALGRVAAVIQARMGSSRLPGKVLEPLAGRPMVSHVVERARRIEGIEALVVAIPDLAEDDVLAAHLDSLDGVVVTRGSADDVLGRYAGAARAVAADTVVRLTADCPLLCPEVSSRVIAEFARRPGLDYASNTLERTFARGLDTEVFSRAALETAAAEATSPAEREHVTPFLYRSRRFRVHSVVDAEDRSHLRWTVDTAADLATVRAILEALPPSAEPAGYEALLELLERHRELALGNRHIRQKEPGR